MSQGGSNLIISGNYRVLKPLGEGYGGAVFLVEEDGRPIALKQLHLREEGGILSKDEILSNFKEEFSILKSLNHPHIVQILDFGYDSEKDFYYFTTEYIEGQDILTATRESSPEEIEDLFVQILRALSYLHRRRIYHFDLKPQNILVSINSEGKKEAKLIDFGLSAFRKEGVLAGSPAYIAPESLLYEPRDGRADLYSLGVTWYTCVTGKNPFEGKDLKETLTLHKVWNPPPISQSRRGIPPHLDPVLEKLLKKNPSDRYHHPDQVIRDINLGGGKHYPLETNATALASLPGQGPVVGRDKEWTQLISYFDRVFTSRSDLKSGVIISGPPGTGKSRLLKELKYYAQLKTIPVLEGMEPLSSSLSQDSLLIIDDADEESFALADRWLMLFHNQSVFVVLAGDVPKSSSGVWHDIPLKPFDRQGVSQFIQSVLSLETPPDSLVTELYARTEGNPLLLTELLHSLIHSHQLFDEQGRWSSSMLQEIGLDFGKLQVPHTLSEYCQNKYNQLPPGAQSILLAIAFSKAPLSRHDLNKLKLNPNDTNLRSLQEAGLIAIESSGYYQLLNPNFRDWRPQNLSASAIADLHQSLADLFRNDPERKAVSDYHLGLGSEPTSSRFQAFLRYGDHLLTKNLWCEASDIFESSIPSALNAAELVEAHLRLVRPLFRSGQHAKALKNLEEIHEILKKEHENPNRWRWVQKTLREMGSIYIRAGRLNLAHESLKASRVLLEQHENDPCEELILDNFQGSLLMREGKLEEASVLSENNNRRWNALTPEEKRRVLNDELANIYLAQGKIDKAKSLLESQLAFFKEIGDTAKEANAIYGLALCHFLLKQFDDAAHLYESCASLARKLKNEELLFRVFNELGNIAYAKKDWVHASEFYHQALELSQHVADVESSVGIAINLAAVLQRQGDSKRAQLYLRHVIDTFETRPLLSLHQLQFLIMAYLGLGKLFVHDLDWIEARDTFRDALRLIHGNTALEKFRVSVLSGLIESSLELKRMREAQTYFTEFTKEEFPPAEAEELEALKKKFEKEIHHA